MRLDEKDRSGVEHLREVIGSPAVRILAGGDAQSARPVVAVHQICPMRRAFLPLVEGCLGRGRGSVTPDPDAEDVLGARGTHGASAQPATF